mmetsp:Transcript_66320/g.105027  ORF Transcript_66320/g.105027 Transcript_66320/m.105027 type:complete len:297 (+) Transcript_66320:54-944(+)
MAFDAAIFGNYILRTSISQCGSKTFFLSVILTAWCPWQGVRNGSTNQALQSILVFLGSFLSFALRIGLLGFVSDKTWQFGTCDAVSCVLLFMLGIKARMDLASCDAREVRMRFNATSHGADAAGGAPDPEKPKEPFSQWNSAAFSTFMPASEAKEPAGPATTQYGTETQFVPSDGVLSGRPDDRSVSNLLAFVLTFVIIFLAQADDRSITALIQTGVQSPDAICGALLGIFLPTVVAVFFGIFLEGSLIDSRLLFTVSSILLALSFISLTQALLYLDAARPMQQKVLALLNLFTES